MKYLLWLTMATLPFVAFSQKITGSVFDKQNNPLATATVFLKQASDTSIVKMALTNVEGKFEFEGIVPGQYILAVTYTGYTTISLGIFQVRAAETYQAPPLQLEKAGADLANVTVTSKKPLVEVKADKIILNVESSINATGSDALELLKKSPGVLVDRDDNISLGGKNGVQIFIDGRPTPLSGKDLADYLKSLNSASIEAIEIINNPSARFEAAGNAGIINIRLKKNRSFGTNGSLTAGYSVGIYSKYNAGVSFNNRNRLMNVFGNYNYSSALNQNFMHLHRKQADTMFDQHSRMNNDLNAHNFKIGADLSLNNKSSVGFILNGNVSNNVFSNKSSTIISYLPTNEVNRLLSANNRNSGKNKNLNYNLNYRFTDTAGHELTLNADYSNYKFRIDQFQPNYYYHPVTNNELYHVINNMVTPTDIDIYALKGDYDLNFKNGKLSVGGKTSFITTENKFERYDVVGSSKTLDLGRSNFFRYKENINAVYINYNRQFKGLMVQGGLRLENTNTNGYSYPLLADGSIEASKKQRFTRHYTNIFPSGAITFNKNPMSQWNFTFSRRIDRPAYQDLNPFEFKLDEYTFQKGNILLKPQYTWSFGATHTYKYKLNSTLNYSHVTDVHTQLVDTTEKSKSFLTKKNMATQDIISLNITYPFQKKWYSLFAFLNTYYTHYIADFGPGRTIDLDVFAFVIYTQHGFNMSKGWSGELSGWYVSPNIWQGYSKSRRMWSMDAGLQKSIWKGAGNLKLAVSDIFQSMRWKGVSAFAGQHIVATGGWESRLLKLNLTWKFGNNQVKAARQHQTGAEEESKRVINDNNSQGRQ